MNTSSTVKIRPFVIADQEAAKNIVLSGLKDHFGKIDPRLNPDLDNIAEYYVNTGGYFIVAVLNGELVGTGALINESPGTGRIVRVSVDRASRRNGIGRSIASHLIQLAHTLGYRRIVVETNDDWKDALALYRRCGFREYDRSHGETHMVMEL